MTKSLYAIVGMKHRGTEVFVASLPAGEPLLLLRDANNPHDPNAVQVWARGRHVAYLKATQVRPLARRLDSQIALGRGPKLEAKLSIDGGHWPMAEVEDQQGERR